MLRFVHRAAPFLAAAVAAGGAVVACGDDATETPGGGGTTTSSSGGGVDAGRDGKAFVDETDGNAPPDPEGRKPTDPLRVFVTKEAFSGDLDGTSGADTKCKEAAEAAKIAPKGKWVAWLSTPSANLKERLITPAGTLPFQLLDGTSIAKKAADLGAEPGLPLHAIDLSESKSKVTGHAWTGTKNLGEAALTACLAWTNPDADHKGGAGDIAAKDATWTELETAETCDTQNHLYCFEIP